jgi:hypothetical protein
MKISSIKREIFLLIFSFIGLNIFPQTFVDLTGINLKNINNGSVAWGDYDNDGYLDILLTGANFSKIYRNNGNNTFTEQTGISLTGVSQASVAWGDCDNDGDLDILLTGLLGSVPISKIYRNNGVSTFTEQTDISLTGVATGSAAWGDYDNDGDLDILLTGYSLSGYISKIYRNNGDNTFIEQIGISLTGLENSSAAWGDYDNDGNLDLLLTGYCNSGASSKIYRNNGDNTFIEQTGISLINVSSGSVAWGDYDNDGNLDILLTGQDRSNNKIFRIYHNNGNNSFTDQTSISLTGVYSGCVVWGDYDNDGYSDILLTGQDASGNGISKIYRNNHDNSFSEQTSISLAGVYKSAVAWGDFDNDGDLDILLTGSTNSGLVSKIYRNEISIHNTSPAKPSDLQSIINNGAVTFKWNKSLDDETPQNGLSYNLYIYENGQFNYKCPPHAFKASDAKNGKRLITKLGTILWQSAGYTIRNLPPDKTYYWSVQAIDAGLQGGNFGTEQSFYMPAYRPIVQANCITFNNIQENQAIVTWAKGGGSKVAVFIKETKNGNADPIDNNSYLLDSLTPGGWRCIYNGAANTFIVTGLVTNKDYSIQVCEYNGDPGDEKYLTVATYRNPSLLNTSFIEQTAISLTGVANGYVAWGDYNGDGYLDILLTGGTGSGPISKIYRNNGNNTFTEQTDISLMNVYKSSASWGDYDSDGNLDILLTGSTGSEAVSKIYRNNGNSTFTEQTGISLTGVSYSSAAWGDYDNDGKLDILLTGYCTSGPITKIYHNDGNNTFSDQTIMGLTYIAEGSVSWGDYDNDGDLDILLTGYSTTANSKIYRNNNDNTFTELTALSLFGIYSSSVASGDYDNDGDLDILMTGYANAPYYKAFSKVYRYNGKVFIEQTNISLSGVENSSTAWGDYDNDGDLDILITGGSGSELVSKIYRNNGDTTFTEQLGICLPGLWYSSTACGDYDNDGDLDILLTGQNVNGNKVSRVYRNYCEKINKNPDQPENLSYQILNNEALLKWNRVTTDETYSKSITYNIRVGRTSGASDYVSSHSASNGSRKIVGMGNGQLDTTFMFKNLRWDTTYYASVQAVDNSFRGGAFSNEIQFKIIPIQPSQLHAVHLNNNSLLLKWKRGNGDRCIVFAKEGSAAAANPQNYTTYYYNSIFGQSPPFGSTGWYCIYKGEEDSVILSGLDPRKNYTINAIEFQGKNGTEVYASTPASGNIGLFSTALFSEQPVTLMKNV